MIIKICGLSDPDNLNAIIQLRPSMIGLIFYAPSPRNACAMLPSSVKIIPDSIERVGVFVDAPVDHVLHTASRYGLTAVQLHGKEEPADCKALRDAGLKVMKAVGIGHDMDWTLLAPYAATVDLFVFDTLTAVHGGSGRKYDWNLLSTYPWEVPFLLSGGIGPDDAKAVLDASAALPLMAGVDINSRFESRPGCKDASKVESFMNAISQSRKK